MTMLGNYTFRLVLFLFLLNLCGMMEDQEHRDDKLLVIDTDMALDDVRALYALLAQERMTVRGIVTVEGSTSLGIGTDNLIGLLESIHHADLPLFKGEASPHLRTPPWRTTADRLGGAPFPPPREMKAKAGAPKALNAILEEHDGAVHYLALGPLTNLARLEGKHPGALKKIHTLWIPVKFIDKERCTCWNLAWDARSTDEVLKKAGKIVFMDLTPARGIDAPGLLHSVKGSSEAAMWIRRILEGTASGGGHIRLYDDLAAAMLIQPDLVERDEGSRRSARLEAGLVKLSPDAEGNVHVARLADVEGAKRLLKNHWEKKMIHEEDHGHDEGHDESLIPPEQILKTFHGHLGPYVVLGYRMGRLALEKTGSKGHFDITVEVATILEPPPSCLLDGLQLGCGCTLGKRNIEVRESDKPAEALFTAKSGRKALIRLKPGVPDLIRTLVEKEGVEAAGEDLMKRDASTLFEVDLLK